MQLGFVGLGRMGLNMVTRLIRGGHQIVAYDRSADAVARAETAGARGVSSLEALARALDAPHAIWVMVPAGDPTESTVAALGTRLEPIFLTLAPPDGYLRVGDHGAGHYVKMIHNGIEYGLMQAYAEGFELMHESSYKIDLTAVAALWDHGSVVRSWLLQLTARALAQDPDLVGLKGDVEHSGEGRWTLHEGIDRGVPLPALSAALYTRFRSRQDDPFADRLLAALRQQFGGHAVGKS